MRASTLFLGLSLALGGPSVACSNDGANGFMPPNPVPPQGRVPDTGGSVPFLSAGGFHFLGPTAAGGATLDQTPVSSPDEEPLEGSGTFDVTVSGVSYTSDAGLGFAAVVNDLDGQEYAVFAILEEEGDPSGVGAALASMVYVIAPADEVLPGATIQLDGRDRLALFFHGDMNQPEPDVSAAAVSGAVVIDAGSGVIGSVLTASVAGDFGPIDFSELDGFGGGGGGSISAGSYMMTFLEPGDVYCEGSLAGHEADFAGVGLVDLGFGSGIVSVETPAQGEVIVSGPSIQAGFGASDLALASDDGSWMVYGVTEGGGAGPGGTEKLGAYLALDGGSASPSLVTGGAGAGFGTSAGDGWCTVSYGVQLSP